MIGLSDVLGWELLLGIAAVAGAIALASVAAAQGQLPHPASDPERGAMADMHEITSEDSFEEPWNVVGAACHWPAATPWWMSFADSPSHGSVPFGFDAGVALWVAALGAVALQPVGAVSRLETDGCRARQQASEPSAMRRLADHGGRRDGNRLVPPHAAGPAP